MENCIVRSFIICVFTHQYSGGRIKENDMDSVCKKHGDGKHSFGWKTIKEEITCET
jgi:hypothetical protein